VRVQADSAGAVGRIEREFILFEKMIGVLSCL
jgi:hypothetical protein